MIAAGGSSQRARLLNGPVTGGRALAGAALSAVATTGDCGGGQPTPRIRTSVRDSIGASCSTIGKAWRADVSSGRIPDVGMMLDMLTPGS